MLTGPTESVGRANEVPPGIAELNHPRELLHPRFLPQIGIKAHADVADQQTAFRRHLNAYHPHPPARHLPAAPAASGLRQNNAGNPVPLRFYRSEIETEVTNQRLNHVATNTVIAG
jgi:hypothetical protein